MTGNTHRRHKEAEQPRHSRHYPLGFGLRLVRLRKLLVRKAEGKPKVEVQAKETPCASAFFDSLPWADTWKDARMDEVVEYLAGNNGLALPARWRKALLEKL